MRTAIAAARGAEPSSVPANATRSLRRASADPARRKDVAKSPRAVSSPAANHRAPAAWTTSPSVWAGGRPKVWNAIGMSEGT